MLEIMNRADVPAYESKPVSMVQPVQVDRANVDPQEKQAEENAADKELTQVGLQKPTDQEEEKKEKEVTQVMLDEIANDMETLHSVGLHFSKHDDSGRTMIKVINRDTDELIREIPAKKVLDMAAKMEEMIGMLFDQEV